MNLENFVPRCCAQNSWIEKELQETRQKAKTLAQKKQQNIVIWKFYGEFQYGVEAPAGLKIIDTITHD